MIQNNEKGMCTKGDSNNRNKILGKHIKLQTLLVKYLQQELNTQTHLPVP